MGNQFDYQDVLGPAAQVGQFNAQALLVAQMIAGVNTATPVKVVAVTNTGDASPVGYVDVQPLVNQVDGADNSRPHGVLHHLPYFRLQGGKNAVIIDPEIGDIGTAVFASSDISAVKNAKAQASPGSWRRFDMADGLYIGGFLNADPSQYVQFITGVGINIVTPGAVNITSASLTHNGKNIGGTHEHGGVSIGGSNTGAPV